MEAIEGQQRPNAPTLRNREPGRPAIRFGAGELGRKPRPSYATAYCRMRSRRSPLRARGAWRQAPLRWTLSVDARSATYPPKAVLTLHRPFESTLRSPRRHTPIMPGQVPEFFPVVLRSEHTGMRHCGHSKIGLPMTLWVMCGRRLIDKSFLR